MQYLIAGILIGAAILGVLGFVVSKWFLPIAGAFVIAAIGLRRLDGAHGLYCPDCQDCGEFEEPKTPDY